MAQMLDRRFPASRFLDDDATAALYGRLAMMGLAGGVVYDALVGAAAAHHSLPLLTRDRRAANVYRTLDVEVELIR